MRRRPGHDLNFLVPVPDHRSHPLRVGTGFTSYQFFADSTGFVLQVIDSASAPVKLRAGIPRPTLFRNFHARTLGQGVIA